MNGRKKKALHTTILHHRTKVLYNYVQPPIGKIVIKFYSYLCFSSIIYVMAYGLVKNDSKKFKCPRLKCQFETVHALRPWFRFKKLKLDFFKLIVSML